MYKNKVFRAILSWVGSCPPFGERAGATLQALAPKLYLSPSPPTCLPQPAPSFWDEATGETTDTIVLRLPVAFLQLTTRRAHLLTASPKSPGSATQHPAPGGQRRLLATPALGSDLAPAAHARRPRG